MMLSSVTFLFARLVHSCEGVLLVHDVADTGNEALGLHLIVRPARVEIRELDDAAQHLAPLTQRHLANDWPGVQSRTAIRSGWPLPDVRC